VAVVSKSLKDVMVMNMLEFAPKLSKQQWETIAFALAPDNYVSASSVRRLFFLDREKVIDALFKAGAYRLARKLQSKPRR
jgi:hypothetical protein